MWKRLRSITLSPFRDFPFHAWRKQSGTENELSTAVVYENPSSATAVGSNEGPGANDKPTKEIQSSPQDIGESEASTSKETKIDTQEEAHAQQSFKLKESIGDFFKVGFLGSKKEAEASLESQMQQQQEQIVPDSILS